MREAIFREVAATPGVSQMRVDTRLNVVVADDAETDECLAALLATERGGGIAVRAARPASRGTSHGLLFGVDPQLSAKEIKANIDSVVPVCCMQRKADGAVVLEFAEHSPPAYAAVFKLLLPVRARRPGTELWAALQ